MTEQTPNGKPFAHYTVLGKLGRGGMGEVYKAYEESLGREVALKILPARYAAHPKVIERFQREARTSAKLNHPNITPIYAVGEHEGTHYIAMEYVRGRTLFDYIREKGPLDLAEALRILKETADAVREAHRNGILHRDIKPGNIMLDQRRRVKVMDFGLALVSGETSTLTGDGAKLGTPAYMSPEQCEGKSLDVRTDIYSLGVTLYEMLTKDLPFPGDNPQSIMFNIINGAFPDVIEKRPDLPQGMVRLLQNMTATDPVNRYESVRALLDDINRLINDPNYPVQMPGAGAPAAPSKPSKQQTAKSAAAPATTPSTRKSSARLAFGLVSILAVGGIAAFAFAALRNPQDRVEQPVSQTTDSPAPAPAAQLEGLVAHFTFDEGKGDRTVDTIGGNRGELEHATWTQGVRGAGLEFEGGLSSFVQVPHNETLSPREAVTVTAWIKVYDFPRTFACLVYKTGVFPTNRIGDRVYTLWVYQRPDGRRGVHTTGTAEGGSSQVYDSSLRGEFPLNEFVHIAGVVDTGGNELVSFINGEKVSVRYFPGDALRGGEAPMRLGGIFQEGVSRQSTAGSLAGILDEVRIYNRALTTEEIQTDMRLISEPQSGAGYFTYADAIVEYEPGEGVGFPFNNPRRALGPPEEPETDEQFVSLGRGGTLTVQFTDNPLTANGDAAADLYIYENGVADTRETVSVRISSDNRRWIDVGLTQKEFGGIDLDAYIGDGVEPGHNYPYVQLIDTVGQRNEPKSGADIDAVAAIAPAQQR